MPLTGYEATLSGTTLGSLTGVKEIRIGGIEVSVVEIATLADVNRIPEKIPGKVNESPMEITFSYNKTVYATLRTAAKARTEDTFSLADAEASAHAGLGFVSKVGDLGLDTENDMVFTAILTPKTSWAFTPSA